MNGRRLPPYAKTIGEFREAGTRIREIRVYAGTEAWSRRNNHAPACLDSVLLVLPPGESPRDFSWPVRRFQVLVIQAGEILDNLLLQLALCLLEDGAAVVRTIQPDGTFARFEKEVRSVAA